MTSASTTSSTTSRSRSRSARRRTRGRRRRSAPRRGSRGSSAAPKASAAARARKTSDLQDRPEHRAPPPQFVRRERRRRASASPSTAASAQPRRVEPAGHRRRSLGGSCSDFGQRARRGRRGAARPPSATAPRRCRCPACGVSERLATCASRKARDRASTPVAGARPGCWRGSRRARRPGSCRAAAPASRRRLGRRGQARPAPRRRRGRPACSSGVGERLAARPSPRGSARRRRRASAALSAVLACVWISPTRVCAVSICAVGVGRHLVDARRQPATLSCSVPISARRPSSSAR